MNNTPKRISPAVLLLSAFSFASHAVPPEEALSTFRIHPDFQIELVAHEPALIDPVDMEFDAQGRMFVIEMPGYPFPDRDGDLVLLEDNDDDGVYETRKVWATGFEVATSLLPYEGGLLVASPPDILFLKDTDGDDKADHREVVLTGFAVDNQQHNVSGLTLGLDNWIYIANGGNSGNVHFPDTPDEKVSMRYDDMRFRWSSKEGSQRALERYGRTTGGFELTHDNFGRWYGTHNTDHIQQLVFPGNYLSDIPAPRYGSLARISDHEEGDLARIYPIGAQDTRVNHPEQSGYFSGACGITFYNGGAFGDTGFNDTVFVCDVVLNLVHVDRLVDEGGSAMTAQRHPDHTKSDFLASTDRAFRPVNATVGPDGSLYVLDMYREVIEHPEWIPDEIEEGLDIDAGKDAGRLYRIQLKSAKTTTPPNLNDATNEALVASLGHANGWVRKTAQRLLIERDAQDQRKSLEALLDGKSPQRPETMIHGMWILNEMGLLSDRILTANFFAEEATVRENAFWIAAERVNESPLSYSQLMIAGHGSFPSVRAQLRPGRPNVRDEENRRNRMIMALVAGQIEKKDRNVYDLLFWIANHDIEDPWSRLAITSAAGREPLPLIERLASYQKMAQHPESTELFASLYRSVGKVRTPKDFEAALQALRSGSLGAAHTVAALDGLLLGLNDGTFDRAPLKSKGVTDTLLALGNADELDLKRAVWSVAAALELDRSEDQEKQLVDSSKLASDAGLPTEVRVDHLRLTEFDAPEKRVPLLFAMLEPVQPAPLQKEAITQLGTIRDQGVAEKLVARWDTLGPSVRTDAGNILLYKRENHDLLLTALENEDLTLGEMNLHLERRRTLLHSRAPGIKERAEKLFSDAGVVTRKEALESMRPALRLGGDPMKGKAVFGELCSKCHSIGGEGSDLAPNLTEIYRKSSETLLHDIVDPNAGANIEYIAYNIETHEGDFFSGIVVRDDAEAVTLRDAEGEHTVSRSDIKEFFSSGLSLMPEELETGMEPQTMADLLSYLQEPK